MDKMTEVGQKMRSAVKAKLIELGCYVDDELPDYIMIMVSNRRSKEMMIKDLQLFLNDNTILFVNWLHLVLQKLQEVTVKNIDVPMITKQEERLKRKMIKEKSKESSIVEKPIGNSDVKKSHKHHKHSDDLVKKEKVDTKTTSEKTVTATDDKHKKIAVEKINSLVDKYADDKSNDLTSQTDDDHRNRKSFVDNHHQQHHSTIDQNISKTFKEIDKDLSNINDDDDLDCINIRTDDDLNREFGEHKTEIRKTAVRQDNKIEKEQKKSSQVRTPSPPKKKHQPIIFSLDELNKKEKKRNERDEDERKERGDNDKFTKREYSTKSKQSSQQKNNNVHKRLGLASQVIPVNRNKRREKSFEDRSPSRKKNTLSSIVKITPRPLFSSDRNPQINKKLLFKAVEEAEKSINQIDKQKKNKQLSSDSRRGGGGITRTNSIDTNELRIRNENLYQNQRNQKFIVTLDGINDTEMFSQTISNDHQNQSPPLSKQRATRTTPDFENSKYNSRRYDDDNEKHKTIPDDNRLTIVSPKIGDSSNSSQERYTPERQLLKETKESPKKLKSLENISKEEVEEEEEYRSYTPKKSIENNSKLNKSEQSGTESDSSSSSSNTKSTLRSNFGSDSSDGISVLISDNSNLDKNDKMLDRYYEKIRREYELKKAKQKRDLNKKYLDKFGNIITIDIDDDDDDVNSSKVEKKDLKNDEMKVRLEHDVKEEQQQNDNKKKRRHSPIVFNLDELENKKLRDKRKLEKDSNNKSMKDVTSVTTPSAPSQIIAAPIKLPGSVNALKIKERCKYWPSCKQGDLLCEYTHPSAMCKLFPNCQFGNDCLFLHPLCKYDTSCSRLECNYSHGVAHIINAVMLQQANPPLSTLQSSIMKKPFVTNKYHQQQPITTTTIAPLPTFCKFYPECTNLKCPFYHPSSSSSVVITPSTKLCRYGKFCKNLDCVFIHSTAVTVYNNPCTTTAPDKLLKWKQSANSVIANLEQPSDVSFKKILGHRCCVSTQNYNYHWRVQKIFYRRAI